MTKTQSPAAVVTAIVCGLRTLGENRVQEAAEKRPKVESLHPSAAHWCLIGHLQSNKARLAIRTFDEIHTLDRLKLVEALSRIAEEEGKAPYPVLLQVNASEDPAKQGAAPDDASDLLEAALRRPELKVRGLMMIGELVADGELARTGFERLRTIRDRLVERFGADLPELSMGMSRDLEVAIESGSTVVRVGTDLFGPREL